VYGLGLAIVLEMEDRGDNRVLPQKEDNWKAIVVTLFPLPQMQAAFSHACGFWLLFLVQFLRNKYLWAINVTRGAYDSISSDPNIALMGACPGFIKA
jgi:hypothetical protein